MPSCSAYQARSASGLRARKKTPPMPWTASATDTLPRTPHELGEDVAVRAELREPRVLPLGRILLGQTEEGGGADLVRDRRDPLEQRLQPRPCRHLFAALEVDEPAGQAVPNRTP